MPLPLTSRARVEAAGELAVALVLMSGALWLTRNLASLLGREALPVWVRASLSGLAALTVVGVLAARRGSPWKSLGLVRAAVVPELIFGLLGAIVAYMANGVTVGIYLLMSHAEMKEILAAKAGWAAQLADTPLWLVLPLALFVGFYEETVFRGFLLHRLGLLFGAPPGKFGGWALLAVGFSSALFASGHGYQGLLGVLQTLAAGTVFALLAWWRGSIWACIVAHAAIDTFGLGMIVLLRPALERLLHP